MTRSTPKDWVWAYHVTLKEFLPAIAREGLRPELRNDEFVLFVAPDLEGVEPYRKGDVTAVLRFKTPGFSATEDGSDDVLFAGSLVPGDPPGYPFEGKPGEIGVIPPERIQILEGGRFEWLV